MAADPEMADWKPVNVCHFCSSAPSSYYNSGSNSITEHSTPFPWFIKRGETLAEIRERLRIKYAAARSLSLSLPVGRDLHGPNCRSPSATPRPCRPAG